MTSAAIAAWRCTVCGYVHRGAEPPEVCPVCGSPRSKFEPYVEAPATAKAVPRRLHCLNCNHIHDGGEAPKACPVCGAPADRFEPLEERAAAVAEARVGRVVVVGAGIAGVSAVEAVRAASPSAEIVLISKEPELPYYRLNLTRYVAGEISEADLPIHPADWYESQNIRLLRGAEVSAILLEDRAVELGGGGREPFNKLILCAGAHAFVPPFPGADVAGVTVLRSLGDAQRIVAAAGRGVRIVCIGGGILGLETAAGLARRGADVTVLEGYDWLMPRQLNRRAGEILEAHVASLGVRVRRRARTAEITGGQRLRGVRLEDGAHVDADLVVVATGIRPNSYLARAAGLQANQGIVVDDHLMTLHPDVFAAGDVAEHRGVIYGVWAPAQYQGQIAGMNALGLSSEFGGIPRANTLKVLGVDMFSIGQFEPGDASSAVYDREADGSYRRFVFHDNRLVGAILLGDTSLTAPVKRAIETQRDFSGPLSAGGGGERVIEILEQESA